MDAAAWDKLARGYTERLRLEQGHLTMEEEDRLMAMRRLAERKADEERRRAAGEGVT